MGETKWWPWICVVIQMAVIDFAPPRHCNCFWGKPNSQWLKYFLKTQFKMGWNCFWSNPNGPWVEVFSEGSIYNGLKWFWSNPNSQWVEIFSKRSIYNELILIKVEIVSDTTQIWNELKSFLDVQRYTKLIQVVPTPEIWFLYAAGLLRHQIFQENESMSFRRYSGLFGIYDPEGQNKGINPILNTSWFEFGATIMIFYFLVLPLGVAFKTSWYAKILFLSRISPLNISEPSIPFSIHCVLVAHHLVFPICENLHNTLESWIDVGQGITVGPGKVVKKNKRRAWTKCANLCYKKPIKLENICRPWEKFQNSINVGPLISL